MTDDDKDRILDILWRAMSAAAGGKDIPMEAQLIADEALEEMGRIIAASSPDSGGLRQSSAGLYAGER